jgi:hypothetical protein
VSYFSRQSTWKCSQCFNAQLIILRDRKVVHKAPKCNKCLKECVESQKSRVTSNYCSVQVFEAHSLKNRKDYSTASTLEIRLFGKKLLNYFHKLEMTKLSICAATLSLFSYRRFVSGAENRSRIHCCWCLRSIWQIL